MTNHQATAPTAAPVQLPVFLEILGLQSFRNLWLRNGLSDMGEKNQSMAIARLVLERTDSTLWVGIVNSIPAISVVFFGVLSGMLGSSPADWSLGSIRSSP